MSEYKQLFGSRLKSFVSEFSASAFLIDGKVLYCKYSDIKIGSEKRFNVTLYINAENNRYPIMRKEKNQNLFESRKVHLVSNSKKAFMFSNAIG